jgi:hypothetical protein
VRILALLLAASLALGCEATGHVLTYGADGIRQPDPNPMDLIPKNTAPEPELAGGRRITEQDCSKPIDPTLGNIRCK